MKSKNTPCLIEVQLPHSKHFIVTKEKVRKA